jgi:putative IMPACT (imprinted ancient) family translation regulator
MRVPLGSATAELEVKRSRFLAYADPFDEPDHVKRFVEAMREHHPGCNHVCHAFLSGREGERFGMSDDHEPHGTAGRPMLEVLRGSG